MEFKDYYQVMGVARDATEAQIKQAYRRLARKYHPDVSKEKDAEARFKELGEAYEVLKSPEKRAAYDQLGRGPRPGEDFRPPPDWGSGFEFSGAGDGATEREYSEFFESLFGAAARGAHRGRRGFDPRRGESGRGLDHHAKVILDLEATLQGGSRALTLRVPEINAEGHLISTERVLNVQIPKGILPGQTIRLAGQGAGGGPGAAGDLYIEVDFQPHPLYRPDGRDLYLDLPVAPWEAALGASVKTPTPGGLVDLKIPAGSRAGTKMRLKGRGIPAAAPGDLYVVLGIALPPATDEKAQAAYRAMADAFPFNPRAQLGVSQ
ncbi:MAG TPA: DnaJ C-terminal domain-containing protein [Steroidobacteraceae bacterium]|nr:DnaJ C-terminal domain-containing protein [Steroidobacteraceae bacterium]